MKTHNRNPLRLLYLSCARIPSEKAHAYQILKMCEAFTELGAAVTLLYQRRPHNKLEKNVPDVFGYYGIRTPFAMKKLCCLDLPFLEKISPVIRFYITTATYLLAAACFLLLRRKSFDGIYCRDTFSLVLLSVLKPLLRLPVFYEIHLFPESYSRLYVHFVNRVDGVIVLTGQLGERCKKNGVAPAKVLVAHDAVDIEHIDTNKDRVENVRARLGVPRNAVLIGYVGRFVTMEQEKGIKELIGAMNYMGDYRDILYMAFIGGPMSQVSAYRKTIAELRLDTEHFRFHDLVPVQEVPAYLAACDILAMPFPWTPHYAFNMSPLKMFEYMAAEKPIVATKLPSVMEILRDGDNAVLVEPDSAEELARGIRRIIEQKGLARMISRKARLDVDTYSWVKRAEHITSFIQSQLPH